MNRQRQNATTMCIGGFLIGALACVSNANAQGLPDSGSQLMHWHIDAGYGVTAGETSDFFDDGLMLEGGLTWRPNGSSAFSLRADLRYLGFDATDDVVQLGGLADTTARIDDGDASIVGLNLGGAYQFQMGERLQGYVTLGLGPYRRDIELTQTALFRGFACDPFIGVCYDALVVGDVVVADDDTTRLGWSGALGLQYPIGEGALFLEARYLRVQTDEPTEIVPIQVGYRF